MRAAAATPDDPDGSTARRACPGPVAASDRRRFAAPHTSPECADARIPAAARQPALDWPLPDRDTAAAMRSSIVSGKSSLMFGPIFGPMVCAAGPLISSR